MRVPLICMACGNRGSIDQAKLSALASGASINCKVCASEDVEVDEDAPEAKPDAKDAPPSGDAKGEGNDAPASDDAPGGDQPPPPSGSGGDSAGGGAPETTKPATMPSGGGAPPPASGDAKPPSDKPEAKDDKPSGDAPPFAKKDEGGDKQASLSPSAVPRTRRIAFNDPPLGPGGFTQATESLRCSTCFNEFVRNATEGTATPMPLCPNCGADTVTAAGTESVVARRHTAGPYDPPVDLSFDNNDDAALLHICDSMQREVAGGERDANDADLARVWAEITRRGLTPPPMPAPTVWKAGRRTAAPNNDGFTGPGSTPKVTSDGYDPKGAQGDKCSCGHTESSHASGTGACAVSGCGCRSFSADADAKAAAKIAQITDAVLQTNPGMHRAAALAIAIETVDRYPVVKTAGEHVKAAADIVTCPTCGGQGQTYSNGIGWSTCSNCGGRGTVERPLPNGLDSIVERDR